MRYLRLYLHFLRFSFSKAMEFRLDFFFRVVMDAVFYAVQLAFFSVLFRHTSLLGDWTLEQVHVFVAGVLVLDAIHMTVFANNFWWLPIFINRGDLDYYLVRPVSTLFFVTLRDFGANSFLNLILAAGILIWKLCALPEFPSVGSLAIYLAFLALGAFLVYALRVFFILPVFWIHSGRGLDEISWSLLHLGERPHQLYHPWLRRLFTTLLPLAFIASVPAHVLLHGVSTGLMLHAIGLGVGVFALLLGSWKLALKYYSSASS